MSTVKSIAYAMFATGGKTHQQIADAVIAELPTAKTTARSIASMYVDYKRAGNKVPEGAERSGGQVKALVYAMLAEGGMTHVAIAAKVREIIPTAQTTHKSVASMAVDWRRSGATKRTMQDDVYDAYYGAE